MNGQISLMDWIPKEETLPLKSGMYTVKDRKGRVYSAWFEKTINGFDSSGFGKVSPSYSIVEWRYI